MDTGEEKDMNAEFSINGKKVTVFKADSPCASAVYLNSYDDEEGEKVWQDLKNSSVDVNLIVISSLDWNNDMSPYAAPSVFRHAPAFSGGADKYLDLLTEKIIPAAEEITGPVKWRGIAGYSLAGLFAVYSAYRTDMFSRIVSVSGSLWFPGFLEYALSNSMKADPEKVYLSLGDREARTGNPVMKTVQDNTERLHEHFQGLGISSEFELNPGNHFQDAVLRMAKGIRSVI